MKKLLIIDDVPEYVNSLKNALKSDFDIETAFNLEEAKKQAVKDIDIFLVDIRLNDEDNNNYDGIVFLEWVKKEYPDKPVVLMSAFTEYEQSRDEIIKKGAADFMKKPIFLSELRSKLKELVNL